MWWRMSEKMGWGSPAQERKETGRLEALSDGVFAIAMTLLVLGIPIPSRHDFFQSQATSLFDFAVLKDSVWLSYIAYVVSFLTILVMWVNHHSMFQFLGRIDRAFVMTNGLLLMLVVFVNYPTALVANFIDTSGGTFAAAFYSGTLVLLSIVFQALWLRMSVGNRLLADNVDPVEVRETTIQYRFGAPLYLAAFALAFISPPVSVGLNAALAIYFAFTGRITRTEVKRDPIEAPHHMMPPER